MTIGDRLKEVRKAEGLTQEAFGEKIGLGKTAIADFESGRRLPTVQSYMLLEQRFGVRREWLETGVYPMYVDGQLAADLAALAKGFGDDRAGQFKKRLVHTLAGLSTSQWVAIADVIERLAGTDAAEESEAERLHRQLDEQIQAEKRDADESEVL